jgi:fibronectin type 3 domain-containing protein
MNKKVQSSKFEVQSFRFGTKATIFLWILLVLMSACAKKGPPVPWESIVPKRIVDLQATSREGRVLLEWTVPKENTDKSPLTDLAGFRVLRSEGVLIGDECKGCREKTKAVREINLGREEEVKKKRMTTVFEDQEARKVYIYEVVSVNQRGDPSSPSNPVTVYWDDPPPSPTQVRAEFGDKKVDLFWEAVEGATGYNVYRRTEGEEQFPINPLNSEPLTVTQYTDLNVQYEIKYLYSVRSVKRVVKTDVEGKGSPDVPVTPIKLTPPSAPVELVAIPLKEGMELSWRKNPEPDLLGYNVYRRMPGEPQFEMLNESPLTKETYLDTHVELGKEYEYTVKAVDNSPRRNESAASEEVRVKYLY